MLVFCLFSLLSCKESADVGTNTISDVYNYPNPFSPEDNQSTTILIKYNNNNRTSRVLLSVDITSMDSFNIWSFEREFLIVEPTLTQIPLSQEHEIGINWGGQNDAGTTVNPGVYIADIVVKALEQVSEDGSTVVSVGGNVNEKRIRIVIQ